MATQLVQKIKDSFVSSEYPGDDKLVYDTSGYDLECVKIADAFKGKRWENLSLEMLRYHHESLFFFTHEAYRYYLPAFLLASIIHYNTADMIPHSVIRSLTAPKRPGPNMDRFLEKVSGFSAPQKTVIREFLELMAETNDFALKQSTVALRRYWRNQPG